MNAESLKLSGAGIGFGVAERTVPWTSAQWREYFRRNAAALMRIPWEFGVGLNADERHAIAVSMQEFQLGESSDGYHFLHAAREYAARSGDALYVHALRRLIAEEQRHGRDLGRVLDLAGIERIRRAWADTVFRWLRRQAGLELSISILVTAEIIAQVYYIALRDATGSIVLRALCNQILRDEDEHVRFQCERLAILRIANGGWKVTLKLLLQHLFFTGTCLVFWLKHSPVMRAGGFGFLGFCRAGHRQLRVALCLMDPRRYRLQQSPIKIATSRASNAAHPDNLDLGGSWLEL